MMIQVTYSSFDDLTNKLDIIIDKFVRNETKLVEDLKK